MQNPYQSEVELIINGRPTRLVLTLRALAALEYELKTQTLQELLDRFAENQYSARDLIMVLNAGLYGAGQETRIEDYKIEGGAKRAAEACMELLVQAFPATHQNYALS